MLFHFWWQQTNVDVATTADATATSTGAAAPSITTPATGAATSAGAAVPLETTAATGAATGTGSATPQLSTGAAGSATGTGTATPTESTPASGAATGAGAAAPTTSTPATGASTATGAAAPSEQTTASGTAQGSGTAAPTVQTPAAGSGSGTGAANPTDTTAATGSASGTGTAAPTLTTPATGAAVGTGAANASGTVGATGTGAATGTGNAAPTENTPASGSATASGAASPSVGAPATGAETSTGTAQPTVTAPATGSATGVGAATADAGTTAAATGVASGAGAANPTLTTGASGQAQGTGAAAGSLSGGSAVPCDRNRDRAVDTFPRLVLWDRDDADQDEGFALADNPSGVDVAHTALLTGWVATRTAAELGPALNALYGRALAAVHADRTLGGRVQDVAEGTLTVDLVTDEGNAPTAAFTLGLIIRFQARRLAQVATMREAALAALATQLGSNAGVGITRREAVLAALTTTIGAVRNPDRPTSTFPAVVLTDGDQAPALSTGWATYAMDVVVTVLAAADTFEGLGPALSAALDPVLAAIHADATLGGLAHDVEVVSLATDQNEPDGSAPLLQARCTLRITYSTDENDPTALPLAA